MALKLPDNFDPAELKVLSPRKQEIIRMYFGLLMNPPQSAEKVGQRFAVTRQRIRSILLSALRTLENERAEKRRAVRMDDDVTFEQWLAIQRLKQGDTLHFPKWGFLFSHRGFAGWIRVRVLPRDRQYC